MTDLFRVVFVYSGITYSMSIREGSEAQALVKTYEYLRETLMKENSEIEYIVVSTTVDGMETNKIII